jgi:hypothetical protein
VITALNNSGPWFRRPSSPGGFFNEPFNILWQEPDKISDFPVRQLAGAAEPVKGYDTDAYLFRRSLLVK